MENIAELWVYKQSLDLLDLNDYYEHEKEGKIKLALKFTVDSDNIIHMHTKELGISERSLDAYLFRSGPQLELMHQLENRLAGFIQNVHSTYVSETILTFKIVVEAINEMVDKNTGILDEDKKAVAEKKLSTFCALELSGCDYFLTNHFLKLLRKNYINALDSRHREFFTLKSLALEFSLREFTNADSIMKLYDEVLLILKKKQRTIKSSLQFGKA